MSAQHTPGPWRVSPLGTIDGYAHSIHGAHQADKGGWPVVADVTIRANQSLANASLIAAAPEMLAMLIRAADFVQPFNRAQDFLEEIEALIAKARGEVA